MKDEKFAFDKASVRTYDADGMMHVELTPLTKANICVYQGSEIPDWEVLGLDANKPYRLLRDPEELAKAVDTFNNKPVLNTHIAVSILEPPKEAIIGATGSNAVFDGTYLKNSLVIWELDSIIGVEKKTQREISASYRYRADVTPGAYEGEDYDIVMRDIACNHVAIVPSGRAGPDVFVYDSKPQETKLMSKLQKIMSIFKPLMAQDADPAEAEKEVEKIIKDSDEPKEEKAEDELTEEEKKKLAKDEEEAKKLEEGKLAQDSKLAMDAAISQVEARINKKYSDLRRAERECEPLIGLVACDSAEDVYRLALKQHGVKDVNSLPATALGPMVAMIKSAPMAQDSSPIITVDQRTKIKSFFEGK